MSTIFKPNNYSTVSPYLIVNGASATIEFLKRVFGAVELRRFPAADGKLLHAEVRIDDTVVMLADSSDAENRQVVGVELQGHQHTADVNRPMSFEQMADDIAALHEVNECRSR